MTVFAHEAPTVLARRQKIIDPRFTLSAEWWAAAKASDEAKKKAAERRATAASCPYLKLVTCDGLLI